MSEIKMRTAEKLDIIFPDSCWASMVMWAMGHQTFEETFNDGSWRSLPCIKDGIAWCGKEYCLEQIELNGGNV